MNNSVNRYLRNLLTSRWSLNRAFPPRVLQAIERAIADSETRHGGELCFAVETALDFPSLLRGTTARDRALDAFAQMRTWDTEANNGVLIYLLLAEHDIEIVADRGYTGQVEPREWQQVCDAMRAAFGRGEFEAGALAAIEQVTALMQRCYPPGPHGDNNELPNRPVVL